jgi:hypothetical protein
MFRSSLCRWVQGRALHGGLSLGRRFSLLFLNRMLFNEIFAEDSAEEHRVLPALPCSDNLRLRLRPEAILVISGFKFI